MASVFNACVPTSAQGVQLPALYPSNAVGGTRCTRDTAHTHKQACSNYRVSISQLDTSEARSNKPHPGTLLRSVASHENKQSMLHEYTIRAISRGLTPVKDTRHTREQLMEGAPRIRTKHKSAHNLQGSKGTLGANAGRIA